MLPNPAMSSAQSPDQPMIDALVTLHTRSIDSRMGYEKMVEKAEPEFRPTVQSFHNLHADHASVIARILADKGYSSDDEGSIMGSINRAVVAVRSFFDDVDADLMAAIHDGEQHVLAAFSDALAQPLPTEDVAKLTTLRDDLVALLAKTSAAA